MQYRASNSIGNSEWSDIAFIRASYLPAAPPIPQLVSVDQTQISLQFLISTDDGGSTITKYHLYVSEGAFSAAFTEVTNYDGTASTYTISAGQVVGTHTVSARGFYAVKYVAENGKGVSLDSAILYVALARAPATPSTPTISQTQSTRTSMKLEWTEGTSVDIPVTGYQVYSDKGLPGNSYLVYEGSSTTLAHTQSSLTPGTTYSYTLTVLNYNGASA